MTSLKNHRTFVPNKKIKQMNFYIERSTLMPDTLFLKDQTGHCHTLPSVEGFLKSQIFRQSNPELIPIFEKAETMMRNGKTGLVEIEPI